MKNIILLTTVDAQCSADSIAQMMQTIYGLESCAILALPAISEIEEAFACNNLNTLLDMIWSQIQQVKQSTVLLVGLTIKHPYASQFNQLLAAACDCQVLLLTTYSLVVRAGFLIQNELCLYAKQNRVGLLIFQDIAPKEAARTVLSPDLAQYPVWFSNNDLAQLPWQELLAWLAIKPSERFTPTMLRYYVLNTAKQHTKRILLPESQDLRVLQAANLCQQQGIAQCVLFGKREQITANCAAHRLQLASGLEIIDPDEIRADYAQDFYELRKHKGATMESAQLQVQNDTILATLLLKRGTVDGLVSGACHTTADTLSPAFRLIKPQAGEKLVSSVFFVCLANRVLAFADCAVNPNPTPEELAVIAMQSARTARTFGMQPKVAMLSYSTLGSGTGVDAEAVKLATKIAQEQMAGLVVDGPLQYDAAVMPDVARLKAPNSKVAGQANVLVFPSLEAGNIGYKIAQRSAEVVCIGPVLQGLAKPVNDLSRGCLVEDIVLTVAVTAAQAVSSAN